jgi:hypothetical protein
MDSLGKKIEHYLSLIPELTTNHDNTQNILDLESGAVKFSINSQLNISLKDDAQIPHMVHEPSK